MRLPPRSNCRNTSDLYLIPLTPLKKDKYYYHFIFNDLSSITSPLQYFDVDWIVDPTVFFYESLSLPLRLAANGHSHFENTSGLNFCFLYTLPKIVVKSKTERHLGLPALTRCWAWYWSVVARLYYFDCRSHYLSHFLITHQPITEKQTAVNSQLNTDAKHAQLNTNTKRQNTLI